MKAIFSSGTLLAVNISKHVEHQVCNNKRYVHYLKDICNSLYSAVMMTACMIGASFVLKKLFNDFLHVSATLSGTAK